VPKPAFLPSITIATLAIGLLFASALKTYADEPASPANEHESIINRFRIPLPIKDVIEDELEDALAGKSAGLKQFWGDVHHYSKYRIQRHCTTDEHRLLDPQDAVLLTGTLKECQDQLHQTARDLSLPPMSSKVVLMLHGIVRTSRAFHGLGEACATEGMTALRVDYPSTRVDIPSCAEYLHSVITNLDGVEEINLVVHSMGGLVARAYFSKYHDPRLKRLVMLGVPNAGAKMADHMRGNLFYRVVFGPAGQQLSPAHGFVGTLPTPPIPFAIIAGAKGDGKGWNPLLSGDDDGTVELASTRLTGAADFIALPCLHTYLIYDPVVMTHTIRFLQTGLLREDAPAEPIN
jgi:pimeloyl-ACP methyl ester carboxylesterase